MASSSSNPNTTSAKGRGSVDPKALMAIKNLELRARVVVEGFWNGLHRSPYHGFSVEFTEYRQYSQGDDTRYLDWRLYARSDRYYLKKFEDETNLRCHLVVDQSRSMTYGSLGFSKSDYARTLAATLAWFLNEQGDAVGLFTFDSKVREYMPARHRPGHLRQLMHCLEKSSEGEDTNLSEPLERVSDLARKRGMIILISDLLAPIDSLARNFGRLAAAGHEVVVFHVLDPNEIAFQFDKPMMFTDAETQRDIYLDPAMVREDYQKRLQAHADAMESLCIKWGFEFHRVLTNNPLDLGLLDFLQARNRRGRLVRRNTQSGAGA